MPRWYLSSARLLGGAYLLNRHMCSCNRNGCKGHDGGSGLQSVLQWRTCNNAGPLIDPCLRLLKHRFPFCIQRPMCMPATLHMSHNTILIMFQSGHYAVQPESVLCSRSQVQGRTPGYGPLNALLRAAWMAHARSASVTGVLGVEVASSSCNCSKLAFIVWICTHICTFHS